MNLRDSVYSDANCVMRFFHFTSAKVLIDWSMFFVQKKQGNWKIDTANLFIYSFIWIFLVITEWQIAWRYVYREDYERRNDQLCFTDRQIINHLPNLSKKSVWGRCCLSLPHFAKSLISPLVCRFMVSNNISMKGPLRRDTLHHLTFPTYHSTDAHSILTRCTQIKPWKRTTQYT